MKKILSLMLAFTLMAGMLSAVSVEAYSEWTTVYDKCYTDSSQFTPRSTSVSNATLYFDDMDDNTENTFMQIGLAGKVSDLNKKTDDDNTNVYSTSTTAAIVDSSTVPGGTTEELSDKVVKFTQDVNACMFRLRESFNLVSGDTVRVTFKMYLDDIALKSGYTTADGTAVALVEDTDNTVEELGIRLRGQDGTANRNPIKNLSVPVGKWVTVSEVITLGADTNGIRMDFGSNASADKVEGYETSFAQTIYFDGNIKVEKLTENTGRAEGNRWITASDIGFEDKANGYIVDEAVVGGVTPLMSLVSKYPECEVEDRGENVYKFSMNNSASSAFKISDLFDSYIETGDIVKISAYVFATDITGGTSSSVPVRIMYGDNSTTSQTVNVDADKWTKIGFTMSVTDAISQLIPSVVIDAASSNLYANTLLIDNIKAEVYAANNGVPTNLDYTEDFDTYTSLKEYNTVNASFTGSKRARTFGNGVGTVSLVSSTDTVQAYSNESMLAHTGKTKADAGMKINDIFNGKLDESDVGKIYRISIKVYPDKSTVYDSNGTAYADTGSMTSTVYKLGLGGPDDQYYQYRTGNGPSITQTLPYNQWSEMSIDFTVTEDYLDNGSTTSGNPLISSLRIDQQGADGSEGEGITANVYVDDLRVKEIPSKIVTVANCFRSNMLFQRNMPINVWGFSALDDVEVTAEFNGETKTTTTKDGKWNVSFSQTAAADNLTLKISSSEDEDEIVLDNIAVGELILASGQSNMNFQLQRATGVDDIKADTEVMKNIRMLTFTKTGAAEPQAELTDPSWKVASSSNIATASAIGYITAYHIAKNQNIPVGFINASLGGASIDAFLSGEVLESREEYDPIEAVRKKYESGALEETWKYHPTGLYNNMLHPLKGMSIGSAIFYQGESNAAAAHPNYSEFGMEKMTDYYKFEQYDFINMLRELYNNEDMPVVICQLAPYTNSNYAYIRQVQLDTARRMDNVSLVATCDAGPVNSDTDVSGIIHPTNKGPVGYRCYLALNHYIFNSQTEYTGPEFEYMEVKDGKAVLHFSHADGLYAKKMRETDSDKLTGFEISQDGTTFYDADATISGNTVTVSSDSVTSPVEVRYQYGTVTYYDGNGNLCKSTGKLGDTNFETADTDKILSGYAGGNLYNSANLPCPSFIATAAQPVIASAQSATENNILSYTVVTENSGYSAADAVVYAAVYTNGELKYIKSFDSSFATQDRKTFTASFTTDLIDESSVMQMFFWKADGTLVPHQASVPVSLNN